MISECRHHCQNRTDWMMTLNSLNAMTKPSRRGSNGESRPTHADPVRREADECDRPGAVPLSRLLGQGRS